LSLVPVYVKTNYFYEKQKDFKKAYTFVEAKGSVDHLDNQIEFPTEVAMKDVYRISVAIVIHIPTHLM